MQASHLCAFLPGLDLELPELVQVYLGAGMVECRARLVANRIIMAEGLPEVAIRGCQDGRNLCAVPGRGRL